MRVLLLLAVLLVGLPPAAHAQSADTAEPTLYVFGPTGLRATLPPGWSGPASADESRLPAYAAYALANREPGPLAGAVLRAERVVGLNPLERQRWQTGQTPYGYAGAQPVGPAEVPIPGARGVAVVRGPISGVVAFVQRGQTFWAVSLEAPAAVWAADRAALLGVLRGLTLPEATDPAAGR